DFSLGQEFAGATVSISNVGPTATFGIVTVALTQPSSAGIGALQGDGWNCSYIPAVCTRSDRLAPQQSYPPISLWVNVAANVSSPLVYVVQVTGGNSAAANATDSVAVGG